MTNIDLKEQLIYALFPYVLKRPIDWHETLAQAIKKEPAFVAKTAQFCREVLYEKEKGFLLALSLLSQEEGKDYGKKALKQLIQQPEDVLFALHCYLEQNGKPIAHSFKQIVAECFQQFQKDAFVDGKTQEGTVTYADFMQLIHPKPLNEEQSQFWKRLLEGGNRRTLDVYQHIHQALNTYGEAMVCRIIRRDKAVSPFHVFQSYQFLRKRGVAISENLQQAFENRLHQNLQFAPKLKGKTFLTSDVSASMHTTLSVSHFTSYRDIAQFFMMGTSIRYQKSIPSFYASAFQRYSTLLEKPLFTHYDEMNCVDLGYEHNAKLAVGYLLENALFVDRIVLFSDKPTIPQTVERLLATYKEEVNASVSVHIFYLAGAENKAYKQQQHVYYNGWSDMFYPFFFFAEQSPSQVVTFILNQ